MITLGIVAATLVSIVEAKRRGEDWNHVYGILLLLVPLGFIGARLYHVIDLWDYYSQHPAQVFGGRGLGIFGALAGGALGLIIYARWKKLSILRWLDIAAPGVILAQAIGRWGNFFNQELYGYPTNLPWAIPIDPEHRLPGYEEFTHFHPLFLYEFLWNLLGFGLLMVLGRKLRHHLLDGEIILGYFMYYSVGRFFFEGLKIDVWTLGGIPTARWITGIGFFVCIAVIVYRRYRLSRGRRKAASDAASAP
jgi:phosphatidylglycerol:prolipoprotein diacylglycerol transferase